MLTPNEAKAAIAFLDRCSVQGHKERIAMNQVVQKLSMFIPMEEPADPETKEEDGGNTEGTGDEASGD